ncbi:MAG TPA: 3-keto-5-aminohexanoate cleavage protein, partial [Gemmatimonadaceae bacterium]|nr:3-keto-5-aminohexanoate cleavage protein [Gemmatimonadaceae bacterium]
MSHPCIITAAITGSVPRKENNPAVPITVSEQIESTHACYEAGAALVHVHVRNDDQSTTSNPDKFADFQERLRRHCPDMIVQFSTGGRSGVGSERGGMLHLGPDMASLSTGSCNFPTRVYENPPELILELAGKMNRYGVKPEIEVFDLAMLYNAINYVRDGLIEAPLHVQFVLGVKHALP